MHLSHHSIGEDNWTVLIKHNCPGVMIIKGFNSRPILTNIEQNTVIKGQLLYNTVPVSAIQQHKSKPQVCPSLVNPLLPPTHPSPLGCHRALSNPLHHTTNSHLHLFYIWQCTRLPGYSLLHPQVSTSLFLCVHLHGCPYSWGSCMKKARLANTTETKHCLLKQNESNILLPEYFKSIISVSASPHYEIVTLVFLLHRWENRLRVQVTCQGHS